MNNEGHRGGHHFSGEDGALCEKGCGKTAAQVNAERLARARPVSVPSQMEAFAQERRRSDLADLRNERRRIYGR